MARLGRSHLFGRRTITPRVIIFGGRFGSDALFEADDTPVKVGVYARIASDTLISTDTAVGVFSSIYDPRNLTVSASGTTAILSWTASTTLGVLDYSIFRRSPPTGVPFNPRFDTPVASSVSATTYSDTGLTSNTTYEWQVFGRIPVA